MGILFDKGIIKSKRANYATIFEKLFPNEDFLSISFDTPKDFVNKYWSRLKSIDNWLLKSRLLELIMYSIFYRERVSPLYIHSELLSVPNIKFSCVAITKYAPICFLSILIPIGALRN